MRHHEAFARMGAKPAGPYASHGWAPDALVVSLYQHLIDTKTTPGTWIYGRDRKDAWHSPYGWQPFTEAVRHARNRGIPIRLISVIVAAKDQQRVLAEDNTKIDKDYQPRPYLVGRVDELGEDFFTLHFTKEQQ